MRRKDLERLPSVSVRGRVYVELDALVAALDAEKAEAADAETTTERSLPRPASKDKA